MSAVLAIEAIHLGLPGGDGFLGVASLVIIGSNLVMAIGLRVGGRDAVAAPAADVGQPVSEECGDGRPAA